MLLEIKSIQNYTSDVQNDGTKKKVEYRELKELGFGSIVSTFHKTKLNIGRCKNANIERIMLNGNEIQN